MSSRIDRSPVGQPKEGRGYRIEEQRIRPELAALAGREALLLKELTRRHGNIPFIKRITLPNRPYSSVLAIDIQGLTRRGHSKNLGSLLAIHDLTRGVKDEDSGKLYLDFYEGNEPAIPVTSSVESDAARTLSIGLLGRAGLEIELPGAQPSNAQYMLEPADAVIIDHTGGFDPSWVTWRESLRQRVDLLKAVNG